MDSNQKENVGDGVITTDLLTEILRASENRNDVVVKSLEITNARDPRDEYLSRVLRLHVSAMSGDMHIEHHMIAKVLLPSGDLAKIAKRAKLFDKEDIVYSKLIPAMNCIQSHAADPIQVSMPKMFKSVLGDDASFIVLEDCSIDGFVTMPFHGHFDFEHCRLVVDELAKFHALSVVLGRGSAENLKPEFGVLFRENHFSATDSVWEMISPVMKHGTLSCLQVFQTVVKDEAMLKRIDDFINLDLITFFANAVKPDDSFNVICHGDVNIRNLMFKYRDDNRKKPTHVKLLDFQISRYASPATDLVYFLYHNTTTSFRRENIARILTTYYETFMVCLKRLNTELPDFSYNVLLDSFKKYSLFGIIQSFGFRTAFSEATGPPDVNAIVRDFAGSVTRSCEAFIRAGEDKEIVECLIDAINQGIL